MHLQPDDEEEHHHAEFGDVQHGCRGSEPGQPGGNHRRGPQEAVASAIAKAKTLAEAAGVSIGRVLEISDQNIAPPPMAINAKAFDAAAGAAVPTQAGENAYNVQVTVTFELK